MDNTSLFENLLIDAADDADRSQNPAILKIRAQSTAYFRQLGFTQSEIAELMNIPQHLLPKS